MSEKRIIKWPHELADVWASCKTVAEITAAGRLYKQDLIRIRTEFDVGSYKWLIASWEYYKKLIEDGTHIPRPFPDKPWQPPVVVIPAQLELLPKD